MIRGWGAGGGPIPNLVLGKVLTIRTMSHVPGRYEFKSGPKSKLSHCFEGSMSNVDCDPQSNQGQKKAQGIKLQWGGVLKYSW